MASGRVKRRIQRPDTWQLPTSSVHQVQKALANPEPSTHGSPEASTPATR